MLSDYAEGRDELTEKKDQLIKAANKGISSNIPLRRDQKKYLKNMLLFVILKTSASKAADAGNLSKVVNKAFKKMFVKLLVDQEELEADEDWDEEDCEDFYDRNIIVEFTHILANDKDLDVSKISKWLSPKNIMGQLRKVSFMLMFGRKEEKENHRETLEEYKLRKKREEELNKRRENLEMLQKSQEFQQTIDRWQIMRSRGNRERS